MLHHPIFFLKKIRVALESRDSHWYRQPLLKYFKNSFKYSKIHFLNSPPGNRPIKLNITIILKKYAEPLILGVLHGPIILSLIFRDFMNVGLRKVQTISITIELLVRRLLNVYYP